MMSGKKCLTCIGTIVCSLQLAVAAAAAAAAENTPAYSRNGLSTLAMGGVKVSPKQLREMQQGDYILHAKDGQLRKVSVQKIPLPLDPIGHVQRLSLFVGPDRTIYAAQGSVLSKSKDGGKTWTHEHMEVSSARMPKKHFMQMRVLADGTWIKGRQPVPGQIAFFTSNDERQTWQEISRIGKELGTHDVRLCSLDVLRDGTLVVPVAALYWKKEKEQEIAKGKWEDSKSLFYWSRDGGKTFSQPTNIGHWGHEINIAELPSGRLLAVIRYQRQTLPSDPPNILDITGASQFQRLWPYKHVFVSDSKNGGKTWSRNRQVATGYGQCHGAAVGLSNKRVVLVHDHRYPRPMSSARAVVSDDEGQTWRNEVYYLSNGHSAGFARTISLDGEEMLTLTGSYYGEKLNWHDLTGNTRFHVIRWRLEK